MTLGSPGDEEVVSPLAAADLQAGAIRGAAWTMIHTLISLPVAFLVNLAIANVLGVADYGRLAFLTALIEVASGFVTLGVGAGVLQFGARAHAAGRYEEAARILRSSLGFRLVVEVPIMVLLVVVVADVDAWFLALAVVFGVLAPACMSGLPLGLAIENKSGLAARTVMISSLLTQAGVLAALFIARTPDAVWAARLALSGALLALFAVHLSVRYRKAALSIGNPFRFPPGFWRFALPTGAAALVATLVMSRTEVFFLQAMSTEQAVGVFALAFGLAAHLFSPAQALVGPLIPAISGVSAVDHAALARALGRTLRAGSTIVGLVLATALPTLAVLVPVLYSSEFAAATPMLLALGIAGGALVVAAPVQAFVQARLAGLRLLGAGLVALLVDVALALALIPPLGAWGAIIANIAGGTTQFAIIVAGEVRALGLSLGWMVRQVVPAVIGALACGLSFAASALLPGQEIAGAAVALTVGFAAFWIATRLVRSGLTRDDAAAIVRVAPRGQQALVGKTLSLLTHHRGAEVG